MQLLLCKNITRNTGNMFFYEGIIDEGDVTQGE